jgi:hypothetical protein
MLACDTAGAVPNYVLYVDGAVPEDQLCKIAAAVESGLDDNFHYRYARRLGQLGPLRVGNVKPVALDARDGWRAKFNGRFVETRAATGSMS